MATAIERVERNFAKRLAGRPEIAGYDLSWLMGAIVLRVYLCPQAKTETVAILCNDIFAFIERASDRSKLDLVAVLYPGDVDFADVFRHANRLRDRYPLA